MGRLELSRLVRTTLNAFLLLLVVPFLQLVPIQTDTLVLGAHPGKEAFWISVTVLLILANTFGQNLFRLERKDEASEYLLTFPKNRWAILGAKVWPRLAIIMPLTLALETVVLIRGTNDLAHDNPFSILIDPLFFPAWVLLLFLLGMGHSLFEQKDLMAVGNFLTLCAWVLVAAVLFPGLRSLLPRISSHRLLGVSLLLAALPILFFYAWAFLSAYRRWDLFAPIKEARPFLQKTLLPLGAMLLLASIQVIFHVF